MKGVVYRRDLTQGTPEWAQARCGLLTASEMCKIITPATLKAASNEKERSHLYELLGQRITQRVEPSFQGFDMLRGHAEEAEARYLYGQYYAPVEVCGFITNDRWGFTLGYSTDGLVADDGVIEAKSRKQSFQIQTVVECVDADTIPSDFMIQVQTGLLVSERRWCDFLSYSNGLPMVTIRVYPIPAYQDAILAAAAAFEKRLAEKLLTFGSAMISGARLIPTVYTPPPEEMYV